MATKYSGYATTYVDKIKSTLHPNETNVMIKFKNEYGIMPEMIKTLEDSTIKFIASKLLNQSEMKEKEKVATKMTKIIKEYHVCISFSIHQEEKQQRKKPPSIYRRRLLNIVLPDAYFDACNSIFT